MAMAGPQVPEESLSDTPSLGMYSEPVDVLVQLQLVGILILGLSRNSYGSVLFVELFFVIVLHDSLLEFASRS